MLLLPETLNKSIKLTQNSVWKWKYFFLLLFTLTEMETSNVRPTNMLTVNSVVSAAWTWSEHKQREKQHERSSTSWHKNIRTAEVSRCYRRFSPGNKCWGGEDQLDIFISPRRSASFLDAE